VEDSQLIDRLGGTSALAKRLVVAPASISEWRTKGIPSGRRIELGADIERVTGVPRWVQRPNDWHRIWPELIGADGAPAVPADQPQEAA
jgi:DNA-binding transcriptional regulator YdaS (Cro superfamily)